DHRARHATRDVALEPDLLPRRRPAPRRRDCGRDPAQPARRRLVSGHRRTGDRAEWQTMSRIARRLDATEGQIWSLAIGLVVAALLALFGIPPVVHHSREPLASTEYVSRRAPSRRPAAPALT